MNDKALVVSNMDDVARAAEAMNSSGYFKDAKDAAQCAVKIMAGFELGFGPFASMTGVSIIQNKPSIGANLLAASIKASNKYNFRVVEHTDKTCMIEFEELHGGKWRVAGVSEFTMQDAYAANLTGKDNWKKYPRNMLFARALSNGQKWYAPDATNGATVYTPDELGATVDSEGDAVIEAQAVEIHKEQPADEPPPEQEAINEISPDVPQGKPSPKTLPELIHETFAHVDSVPHAAKLLNNLIKAGAKINKDNFENAIDLYYSEKENDHTPAEAAEIVGRMFSN